MMRIQSFLMFFKLKSKHCWKLPICTRKSRQRLRTCVFHETSTTATARCAALTQAPRSPTLFLSSRALRAAAHAVNCCLQCSANMKRLRKELSKLKNPTKPADVAKAAAVEKFAEVIVGDDLTKWSVRLKGPDGVDPPMPFAPFVGATFTVEIQFPSEYPFKAPKVKFETPIFHPNVGEPDSDLAGEICAEVLEKGWSPTLDASHIVTTLHQMLLEPNPGGCTVAASARPLAHALRALRALLTILSSSLLSSPSPFFPLSLVRLSPQTRR